MDSPADLLRRYFPFEPTPSQSALFERLGHFLLDKQPKKSTLVLKGYAGTGKTSVTAALVKALPLLDYKFALMAPTGRAAKVMSVYSMKKAHTIHRSIFNVVEDSKSGGVKFKRIKNKAKDTIYLVDEASMINNFSEFSSRGLLESLVDFVFEEHYSGNKLILIGDTAQLPPVGEEISPGLDERLLVRDFGLDVHTHLLTEVVRQGEASGILENATRLRSAISQEKVVIELKTKGFKDIYNMPSARMEDGLRYAYSKFGMENTCVICRSNKSATQYNKFIRQRLLFKEEEIEAGDLLMIVKNSYDWLPLDSKAGFLANGEYVEVRRVNGFEERYGKRYALLSLQLIDYPEHEPFDAAVILDTLHSFQPSLSMDEMRELQQKAMEYYAEEAENKEEHIALVRADPYLNALQVKYAYALTCHKSQGGQWRTVFVDMGFVGPDMLDISFMRWLYTAMTRASEELYLVNFTPTFFV